MTDFRVLAHIPQRKDGTSLYRAMMPLGELQRQGVRLVFVDEVSWATYALVDLVFMQRPFTQQHVHAAEMARINDKPLWVDYDDDLLNVPSENPTSPVYNTPANKKNVLRCLELADIVSVSTPALAESLKTSLVAAGAKRVPMFRVIPNALNMRRWSNTRREQVLGENERQKLILWRGSDTHVRDVLQWAPDIIKAAHARPDYVWCFIGMSPWMLHDYMPEGRCLHQNAQDPMKFMQLIQELRPDILFVPLVDHVFNRAKSNIAWIEGTWAGAQVVAPDWQEWRKPGVTVYDGKPGSLHDAMIQAMDTPEEIREALVAQSWQEIMSHLSLERVNRGRMNIIRELASYSGDGC